MNEMRRISFSDVVKRISENEKVTSALRSLSYLGALWGYGLSVIFLLKISQIILGWKF